VKVVSASAFETAPKAAIPANPAAATRVVIAAAIARQILPKNYSFPSQ
jgi:hypothetical protein